MGFLNFKNKKEQMEEERYVITPKGVAVLVLIKAGIYAEITDGQFELFWKEFAKGMKQAGYVHEK